MEEKKKYGNLMEKQHVEIWDWIRKNRLSLEVLSNYNNNYQLRLRNQYGHVVINDNGIIKNECGKGFTYDEAFNDMIKLYSGKVLFNMYFDPITSEPIKKEYMFPKI